VLVWGVDLDFSFSQICGAELLWVLAWFILSSQNGKDGTWRQYDLVSRVMKSQTLYIVKFTTISTSKFFVTCIETSSKKTQIKAF
jgi:hypothetical protein